MKKIQLLTIGIIIFILSVIPLNAASFGMSSSVREVSPNGSFTISVGGDSIGRVDLTVTNGTLSTNSVWVEQGYVSVRVTAGGSGTVTVTATPVTGFSDADGNMYSPGSRTVSINISSNSSSSSSNGSRPNTPTVNKSGDNNLSSITINNGELTPSFNKDTLDYKVNLNADVSRVTINATPSDSKSKIEGTGEKELNPGHNSIEIKVTAENGNIKTYKLDLYVDETPQVYLDYKKSKVGIIRNFDEVTIPEGFNKEDLKINDYTISTFSKDALTIIYGINELNEKSFYLFDKEQKEIINKFIPLNINNRIIYITDYESKKRNITLDTIKIEDTEVNCYKFKNEENNYCLLNVVNNEGKNIEYLYESSENTIQLFPEFLLKEKKNNINLLIYICIGLIIIPISIIIYLLLKSKKDKKEVKEINKKRGNKNEKTK